MYSSLVPRPLGILGRDLKSKAAIYIWRGLGTRLHVQLTWPRPQASQLFRCVGAGAKKAVKPGDEATTEVHFVLVCRSRPHLSPSCLSSFWRKSLSQSPPLTPSAFHTPTSLAASLQGISILELIPTDPHWLQLPSLDTPPHFLPPSLTPLLLPLPQALQCLKHPLALQP